MSVSVSRSEVVFERQASLITVRRKGVPLFVYDADVWIGMLKNENEGDFSLKFRPNNLRGNINKDAANAEQVVGLPGWNSFVEEMRVINQAKGWWDKPRTVGDLVALMHTELSEAFQWYRILGNVDEIFWKADDETGGQKPEGFSIDLADLLIRVADMCAKYNIDLETAIRTKVAFNKLRPYRHGGKVV